VTIPGQPEPVLAFHYVDPRSQQAFMAYQGPDGQPIPLPPGATRAPAQVRAGAAAGPSLTSYMDNEQLVAEGLAQPGEKAPGLYKVTKRGEFVEILPYKPAPPSTEPFAYTGAGTTPTGGARFQTRGGGFIEMPGPQINPRITAAKALMQAVREQERISGLGTDIATLKQQVETLVRSGRYPALTALTFEQIAQMEKLDELTPDEALTPILQMVPTAPPGSTPPAGPAGAAAPSPAAPPAGWAQGVVEEILREQRNRMRAPQPGVVSGRGVPR
jgi:hypothetical protein